MKRIISNLDYYAIYKGDTFLFIGTKKECAEYLNVKEKSITFYSSSTYRKRGLGDDGNKIIVIKIEED